MLLFLKMVSKEEDLKELACKQCGLHLTFADMNRPYTFLGLFYLPSLLGSKKRMLFHEKVAGEFGKFCQGQISSEMPLQKKTELFFDYDHLVSNDMQNGHYSSPPGLDEVRSYEN